MTKLTVQRKRNTYTSISGESDDFIVCTSTLKTTYTTTSTACRHTAVAVSALLTGQTVGFTAVCPFILEFNFHFTFSLVNWPQLSELIEFLCCNRNSKNYEQRTETWRLWFLWLIRYLSPHFGSRTVKSASLTCFEYIVNYEMKYARVIDIAVLEMSAFQMKNNHFGCLVWLSQPLDYQRHSINNNLMWKFSWKKFKMEISDENAVKSK